MLRPARQRSFFLALVLLFCAYVSSAFAQDGLQEGIQAYANQEFETAARLLHQPAENGNPDAQLKLGILYEFGRGVARDYAEAARWYERAAASGSNDGRSRLARLQAKAQANEQRRAEVAAQPLPETNVLAGLLNVAGAVATGYVQGRASSNQLAEGYKSKLQAANASASSSASAAGCEKSAMESACEPELTKCRAGTQYACFKAAACACQVQKNAGGCGNPPGYLDHCIAKAEADAAKIYDPGAREWAAGGRAPPQPPAPVSAQPQPAPTSRPGCSGCAGRGE